MIIFYFVIVLTAVEISRVVFTVVPTGSDTKAQFLSKWKSLSMLNPSSHGIQTVDSNFPELK